MFLYWPKRTTLLLHFCYAGNTNNTMLQITIFPQPTIVQVKITLQALHQFFIHMFFFNSLSDHDIKMKTIIKQCNKVN